jgi:hypothetical protein
MAIWNLGLGTVFGLLYGPIIQLVLTAILGLERSLQGRSDAFIVDPGTLLVMLILASLTGTALGAVIGLLSSVLAGVSLIAIFRDPPSRSSNPEQQHDFATAVSGAIGGLIGLIVLILINLPSTLAYLGSDWVVLGWILEVAVPALLISGMVWWTSNRVVTSLAANSPAPAL